MKSGGAAEDGATQRIDWRSVFTDGGLEADLSPPATVAVTARSARSVSSPVHPTKKCGGERLQMDWRAMFRAGRAGPPEAELWPSLPGTVARMSADYFSATSSETAPLRIDWRSVFTGGGLEADLSPPATVAVTARYARPVSSPAHPTKKGGGERLEMDWRAMFKAGRAAPPEADLSPSLPATVARKSADYFSATSPETAPLRIDWRSVFTGGGLEADLSPPATAVVTARSAPSVSSPAHPRKKGGGERLRMDWRAMFRAGSAAPPEADLSPSLRATVAKTGVAEPLEAELSPPATDPVAPRSAYSADSVSASWAAPMNRGASDWLFKASSPPRPLKKRDMPMDMNWSGMFKASSRPRSMKKCSAPVDTDWSAMFKASSPPRYMKKHSASADIDWTDMFKASLPSRPMKKRSAQVNMDWTDMCKASSLPRPTKKRGAQVDTDWTAMFKTSSPPRPMKKRSASKDIDRAAMFKASSLSRPTKKHSSRVDVDWTAMFKAGIAEPPEAKFSPEAPDPVAPRPASSADLVSASPPWAHLTRKPGARKDIDWITMFNAGMAKSPEAELSPPVPATLIPSTSPTHLTKKCGAQVDMD